MLQRLVLCSKAVLIQAAEQQLLLCNTAVLQLLATGTGVQHPLYKKVGRTGRVVNAFCDTGRGEQWLVPVF
jgi:hypothetical protein